MKGYGGGVPAARSAAPGDGERFRGPRREVGGTIFPPKVQEGLYVRSESKKAPVPVLQQEPLHLGRIEEEDELEEEEEEEEKEKEKERGPLVRRDFSKSARRIWDSGIEVIQSKFSLCGGVLGSLCAAGAGVWPAAAIAVFAGALMYMRHMDRRETDLLHLLVQEKDMRIAQILPPWASRRTVKPAMRDISYLQQF